MKTLHNISTVLTLTSEGFKNISADFSILADPSIYNSDNMIVLSNMLCDVEMEEMSFNKEEVTLFINIPVMAFNEDLAEQLAQIIVNNAKIDLIHLIDNATNQIHNIVVEEARFTNVEYHIA